MGIKLFKFLKASKKVLGLNGRSLDYLRPLNRKRSRLYADSKLLTKKLLMEHDLPVSEVYGIITDSHDLQNFDWDALPKSFVLKPNRGLAGGGIIVAFSRKKGKWITSSRKKLDQEYIENHIYNILDGHYSLANVSDIAFFEERIKVHPKLKPYTFRGIPDIRIIIHNNVPIMAMLRLPTKESGGKANLAQGGIGVGIDISNGLTTHAIRKGNGFLESNMDYYPGKKGLSLHGIKIPYWTKILRLAIKAAKVSNLGYAGIDIAIDRDKGPIILELNARSGLSIQNANLAGLKDRLQRINGLKVKTAEKGIRLAEDLFGGDIEQELETISGKEIIGLSNKAEISSSFSDKKTKILAKIDTGADSSSIDRSIIEELGFKEALEAFDALEKPKDFPREQASKLSDKLITEIRKKTDKIETIKMVYSGNGVSIRPYVKIEARISDLKFETVVSVVNRKQLKYKMILGKRDLKHFLIDPSKK